MKKLLVVVDMQNDFVTGSLGTGEAQKIVPGVVDKVRTAIKEGTEVIFTRDTHQDNYLSTQEGRNLPIIHCVKNTKGWELIPELYIYEVGNKVIDKSTFGSMALAMHVMQGHYSEVELIGLCTDICVISNALMLKSVNGELLVSVDSSCCAGTSAECHANALAAMEMCQIHVY